MSPTLLATTDALDGVEPHDLVARWAALGLGDLADAELVSLAARHLGVPRRDPADSFVLHAPLELMARAALLRHVDPAARERARQRLVWVAASFDRGELRSFLPVLQAKVLCAETAVEVTQELMTMFGGTAFAAHLPFERYFRDARAGLIMALPNDTGYQTIASLLFPEPPK